MTEHLTDAEINEQSVDQPIQKAPSIVTTQLIVSAHLHHGMPVNNLAVAEASVL